MPSSPSAADLESERLSILHGYGVLDTLPDERLDRIARLAADLAGTPIAMISFVEAERQFFKARVGTDTCETARDASFCSHTIESNDPLVVEDATQDPRFAASPLVTGTPRVRFYAGVPLCAPSGHRLGALCVADTVARTISARTLAQLDTLATLVVDELELTRRTREQERAQAEHAARLGEREAAFRALAENSPDIVARYDRDLRVLYVNPTAERISGMPRAEQVGKVSGSRGAASALIPGWADQIRQVFDTGEPLRVPFSYPCASGELRRYEAILVPEHNDGGLVTTVLSCARDVTEYVEAERRYQALSHLVQSFAFAYDVPESGERPTLTWLTGSVEEVLGRPPSTFLGMTWGGPVDSRDRALSDERLAAALRGESRADDLRMSIRGTERWIRFVSEPEVDPATGRVVRIYGAGQDVTAQKHYEEALVEAKEQAEAAREKAEEMARLKDAFLANMSHEIRTPLTSILGFADLLRDVVDEENRELVELLQTGGRRLRDTLTSVLELSQLQAGRVTLETEPIALAPLVDETLQVLSPQAQKNKVTLASSVIPADLEVVAERGALGRILTNLVGNAIKFTPAGGVVRVEASTEGSAVAIKVSDTGIGISPSFLPHLFDEFHQESKGLDRSHEGSGLGLSITRRLVELMGGTIAVESAKGAGTTVTVQVPGSMPSVGKAGGGSADGPAIEGRPRGPHVLLIEDDESTRRYVQYALKGLSVAVAGTADEGIAMAHAAGTPFDVALVDINLSGGMSGIDLLPLLRDLPACRGTRFVAMTAYALPGYQERFLTFGFDSYIAKPFARDVLRGVLKGDG